MSEVELVFEQTVIFSSTLEVPFRPPSCLNSFCIATLQLSCSLKVMIANDVSCGGMSASENPVILTPSLSSKKRPSPLLCLLTGYIDIAASLEWAVQRGCDRLSKRAMCNGLLKAILHPTKLTGIRYFTAVSMTKYQRRGIQICFFETSSSSSTIVTGKEC